MRPFDPRLRSHLAPARRPLTGVVVSGVLGGVLLIAQAFAVAALVVGIVTREDTWHRAAWWLLGITCARAAASAYADLAAARAAGIITTRLRSRVLRAALDLDATALSRHRSGELALLGTRGVAAVDPYVTRYLPSLVVATVLPPLTLAVIVVLDPWAGLIVALTLPLVPVFAILIGLTTRDRAEAQYRTLSVLAGHFLDVVRGLPTLVTFNRGEFQSGRIREVTDRYRRATLQTLRLAFASSAALELVGTLSVALVAVSVGLRLASGDLGFHTALVVLLLAPEAYWPLRRVGAEFHAAAEGTATFGAIDDLLTASTPVAATIQPEDQVDPVPIRITDLVVRYPGRTTAALVLADAEIPATGITAIVGRSGSGKSTLVQTLLGEIVPDSGTVTLAGQPILVASWRHRVAHVGQTPWLTSGSIRANLLTGRADAPERSLWHALRAVALDRDVRGLADGIDTCLAEDGAGLSAGQRARLALARVLVADRPYVVLDEPTAHLDAATEAVMLGVLTRLAQHATVIVVAHSQAVVRIADRVITLADRPAAVPVARPAFALSDVGRPSRDVPDEVATPTDLDHESPRARRRLLLGTVLGTLAAGSGVALTATAGWLIARSAEHPPVLVLMVAIIGVRTFGLSRPALRYAERLVSHDGALRMVADTRAKVFDLLVPLSPARLGRRRGDLLTSVVDDVDAQLDRILRVRQPILSWLGVSAITSGFAWWLDPAAAAPVAVLAFAGGALALGAAWSGVRRSEAAIVRLRASASEELVVSLQSARQLVLWQADEAAVKRLDAVGRELAAAGSATARAVALARILLVTFAGLAVIATGLLVTPGLSSGSVSGPMAALLLLLPLALGEVLAALPDAGAAAVRTEAARGRLAALAATRPAVSEPAAPVSAPEGGPIELCDLSVGWTAEPVLVDLDAVIAPGAAIGVVGASGCGKSTLAALLVRQLAPCSGSYVLGGHDTASLGSHEVRRHVGLVDDDPYVFASTLRENLRLAAPGSDDEDLVRVLTGAGLAPWFARQPAGLDTDLGDGAAGMSGGERARLGIARALLHDAPILVLDEPTAHLDADTAQAVSATVLDARAGRTLVWITHDRIGLEAMDEVWDLTARGTSPRSPGSLLREPG
ncbi:MAG: cydD [Marmoricola sp.]|nr:cydD [Marmoricola sp.]